MFGLSPVELCLIGAVAVMLYGKRLPEVGRSVGASIAEFRRQWSSLSSELDVAAHIDGRVGTGRSAPRLAGRDRDIADSGHVASPRFEAPQESSADSDAAVS